MQGDRADPFYNVGDFWNDPRRWDGIGDPHKVCFWQVRRADVIDVRKPKAPPPPAPAFNPYAQMAMSPHSPLAAMQQAQMGDLLGGYGSALNYQPAFGSGSILSALGL